MPLRRFVLAVLTTMLCAGLARAAAPSPLLALERIAAGADGMVVAGKVDHAALIAAVNRRLTALPRTACVDLRPALPGLRFDPGDIVMSPGQWQTLAPAGDLLGIAPAGTAPSPLLTALQAHGLVERMQVKSGGEPADLYYWTQAALPGFWRNAFGDGQRKMTTPVTITVHKRGLFGGKNSTRDELFYPVYCAGHVVARKVLAIGAPAGVAKTDPIDVYFRGETIGVPAWFATTAVRLAMPGSLRGRARVVPTATGYRAVAGALFLDASRVYTEYPGIATFVSVDRTQFATDIDQMISMAQNTAAALAAPGSGQKRGNG